MWISMDLHNTNLQFMDVLSTFCLELVGVVASADRSISLDPAPRLCFRSADRVSSLVVMATVVVQCHVITLHPVDVCDFPRRLSGVFCWLGWTRTASQHGCVAPCDVTSRCASLFRADGHRAWQQAFPRHRSVINSTKTFFQLSWILPGGRDSELTIYDSRITSSSVSLITITAGTADLICAALHGAATLKIYSMIPVPSPISRESFMTTATTVSATVAMLANIVTHAIRTNTSTARRKLIHNKLMKYFWFRVKQHKNSENKSTQRAQTPPRSLHCRPVLSEHNVMCQGRCGVAPWRVTIYRNKNAYIPMFRKV